MASSRRIQLPAGGFSALRSALADTRSIPDGVAVLRRVGFELGGSLYAELEQNIAAEHDDAAPDAVASPDFWDGLSALFEELGWGSLSHEEIHPGVGAVASADWTEGDATGIGAPGCHLTTGILSDMLGRVARQDVAVLEVECRGRGQEECRFLFGAPERLEEVFAAVRSGAPYRDAIAGLG